MQKSVERVMLIGDTSGINPNNLRYFVETANCLYGGYYPIEPVQERAKRIMEDCTRFRQEGSSQFIIIDRDPEAFLEAVASVNPRRDLRDITLVGLDSSHPFDRVDQTTGIRAVALPPALLRYPTHPTPAF